MNTLFKKDEGFLTILCFEIFQWKSSPPYSHSTKYPSSALPLNTFHVSSKPVIPTWHMFVIQHTNIFRPIAHINHCHETNLFIMIITTSKLLHEKFFNSRSNSHHPLPLFVLVLFFLLLLFYFVYQRRYLLTVKIKLISSSSQYCFQPSFCVFLFYVLIVSIVPLFSWSKYVFIIQKRTKRKKQCL